MPTPSAVTEPREFLVVGVRLDAPDTAKPVISAEQVWNGPNVFTNPEASYELVLARLTMLSQTDTQGLTSIPKASNPRLAWVVIGSGVPSVGPDVPCRRLTNLLLIDADSGEEIRNRTF